MQEEPFKDSVGSFDTFERPINYPLAIIGAIAGAAVGIAIWGAAAAFSDSFYYITPVLVGAFAGAAARRLGGRGHISLAILALIIGTIGIVLGDFVETAAWLNREFGEIPKDLNIYTEFMQLKIEDDIIRGILYLVGIGAAFITGFSDSNNDKAKNQ
jgi:uncharacterized membrane protein YeaQ/YmgE (transglycosylase-associated protein family)